MGKKIAVSGIAVLIIIMIGVSIVFFLTDDREGPGIEYTDKEITYHEGDDTKELLKDVTAVDAKDGDVSSSLIIENIIILSDNQKAKIIYAAKDSKNNITKVSRIVNYAADRGTGSRSDDSDREDEQTDEGPGSQTGENQPGSGDGNNSQAANGSNVQNAGQDSQNDTEQGEGGQEDPEDSLNPGAPKLKLKSAAVTVPVGTELVRRNFVEEITDDKDSQELLWKSIKMDGEFHMNEPGVYHLELYVVDSDGNKSNREKLTLTVQ
ncbi:hypothetical protein [Diplocloster agilis]|uniref:Uncharacterized protein n=1 Tax=Diplocloster agilis TaxID=2850323 RepID=A0A949NFS4_9FIRM|nr:hypothetical protein [Diplocloster agilis]MBU9735528.1 hypothetical protein [Diplocloster agilis]